MQLGILTDIHLESGEDATVRDQLRQVVERFNSDLQPDAVAVLGDLVEYADADADRIHTETVRHILSDLTAPTYYTAGNHDTVHLPAEEVADLLDQRLTRTVTRHAQDIILLDTTSHRLDGVQGELTGPQVTYLRRALARSDGAVICAHHPLHYHDLSDEEWFTTEPERAFLINKHEVRPILAEADSVRCVVNGHLHESHEVTVDGVPHVTVNAFNKERPDSTAPTGSHAVLTVDEAGTGIDRYDAKDF